MTAKNMLSESDLEKNWRLIKTPPGEEWSGRTRYGAAMFFCQSGLMEADVLEVYRIVSRLDHEDPLAVLRGQQSGEKWLHLVEQSE